MAFRRKKGDQNDGSENPENTDETFGLPEIEYQPLNREGTTATTAAAAESASASYEEPEPERSSEYQRNEVRSDYDTTNNNYEDDDNDGSVWPKIFGILAILALAGVAYWFFGIYQPKQREAERIENERKAKEDADAKAEQRRLAAEQAARDADQRRADSLANLTNKVGSIETLSERTQRYYVVAASAIDGDLLMDKAKILSQKGVNCKIIPPFGKTKFYRLAIAEGDTYATTQSTADGMKGGDYGDALWVIRY
jgi:hypothetical protein